MNPFSPISFLTCTVVIGNDNFSEYLKVSVSQMQTQKHSNSSYNLEIFSWFEVKADMNPFIPVSFLTCAMIIGQPLWIFKSQFFPDTNSKTHPSVLDWMILCSLVWNSHVE